MNLVSSIAEQREWCNFCPDLIMPGETVATGAGLRNPLIPSEPGYAHTDCAISAGHTVAGPLDGVAPGALLRQEVRTDVRERDQGSTV